MFLYIRSEKNCTMPVCLFYHTDLEHNLFFLALFKPIILQFFTILQDNLHALNIQDDRGTRFLWAKNYRLGQPHYKTFSWREFSIIPELFCRKNLLLCDMQGNNYGLLVKTIKKFLKSPIYTASSEGFSLLSSTKFAVRAVGAVWMNINRVRLQHGRELIKFRQKLTRGWNVQLSYVFFVRCSWLFIFERTIFGTRRRDNWPIKLRKQRDLILLQVPAPTWKKWPTNGGKTAESRESFQRLKPGILPKHWAGYYCLTTRAKHNILKPIDVLATSWSCHFKKRCLVDPLHSKLILQIGF